MTTRYVRDSHVMRIIYGGFIFAQMCFMRRISSFSSLRFHRSRVYITIFRESIFQKHSHDHFTTSVSCLNNASCSHDCCNDAFGIRISTVCFSTCQRTINIGLSMEQSIKEPRPHVHNLTSKTHLSYPPSWLRQAVLAFIPSLTTRHLTQPCPAKGLRALHRSHEYEDNSLRYCGKSSQSSISTPQIFRADHRRAFLAQSRIGFGSRGCVPDDRAFYGLGFLGPGFAVWQDSGSARWRVWFQLFSCGQRRVVMESRYRCRLLGSCVSS